eukprot:1023062-Prorocentrum_minimum.AAC.1
MPRGPSWGFSDRAESMAASGPPRCSCRIGSIMISTQSVESLMRATEYTNVTTTLRTRQRVGE